MSLYTPHLSKFTHNRVCMLTALHTPCVSQAQAGYTIMRQQLVHQSCVHVENLQEPHVN
jgi:hypothetical protein